MEPIEDDLLRLLATLGFRQEPRLEGTGIALASRPFHTYQSSYPSGFASGYFA